MLEFKKKEKKNFFILNSMNNSVSHLMNPQIFAKLNISN